MSSNRPRAAKLGALGFAAVALGCAAFAAFTVARMIQEHGYTNEPMKAVVVAKRELKAAEPLTPDALEVAMRPASSIPEGAVATVEELFPAGRPAPVPTTGILKGEPIVPARLASQKQGTGLAALLRPGYRAVAVKVDDSVGRAGLVYPGARVDVLATIRDPEGRGPSTRIAVEDARVLAVESETDVATRKPRKEENGLSSTGNMIDGTVVTIEVSPSDAEVVSLAMREGRVDLALRNGADDEPANTRGATPTMFSAFAQPQVETLQVPPVVAQVDRAGAGTDRTKGRGGSAGTTTPRRRIEIRASDEPDLAPARTTSSGQIETYHAR